MPRRVQEARHVRSRRANLAAHCINTVEVIEYPKVIWRIEVETSPAFLILDDKDNGFFKELNLG